jgi:hypothetical protein
MAHLYKCKQCGGKHEKPTGKKCQKIPVLDASLTEDSGTSQSDDMAEMLKTLMSRLDKLEKKTGEAKVHDSDGEDADENSGEKSSMGVDMVDDTMNQNPEPVAKKPAGGKTFDQLLSDNLNYDIKIMKNQYGRDYFDPRAMLTLKAKSSKAVHIHQFLHERTKRRRQNLKRDLVMESTNDCHDRLVLRTEDNHPYTNISIAEWGAANCRLMNYLLQNGQLNRDEVEFYLAYSAKIYDFADRYQWESILEYDYRYRELQAEYGFKWGVINPDMELQLQPRQKTRVDSNTSRQDQFVRKPRAVEDCKLFMAHGYCRFGENCRFNHRKPAPLAHSDGSSKNDRPGNRENPSAPPL